MKHSIFFTIIFVVCILLLTFLHESVHVVIDKSYGIDSSLSFKFPNLITTTEPHTSEDCPAECQLAHNINEAISYPLTAFLILIGAGFLIIICMMEDRK